MKFVIAFGKFSGESADYLGQHGLTKVRKAAYLFTKEEAFAWIDAHPEVARAMPRVELAQENKECDCMDCQIAGENTH